MAIDFFEEKRLQKALEILKSAGHPLLKHHYAKLYCSAFSFGHLIRIPPVGLPGEVLRGRPGTRWNDLVSRLAREHLEIPRDKLEKLSGER